MKIGRNDPCPCGSGKKYKQCCLLKQNISYYDKIRKVFKEAGYQDSMSGFICNLYRYMKEKQWIGACHATCSILYVGLSELGHKPKICIGEAAVPTFRFDHSWIELDGKIIDLAAVMTLMGGLPLSGPVILDTDIDTGMKSPVMYGIKGSGLDRDALVASETPFAEYMDMYPGEKNGLWGILEHVYPDAIDVNSIKEKYTQVNREYVVNEE